MLQDTNNLIGPHGISANYGWFHVYAFTMFTGIAVSILVSGYKLQRHKIPSDSLVWSIIFIIPASLFGASFFGKNDPTKPISILQMFEFWHPGLSIHGGVLFGTIAGIIFFAFISRKTHISLLVYGDCIIPNILLGQVIGRWGNFFNHELLGEVVGYAAYNGDLTKVSGSGISAIAWLPAFIRDNCFAINGNSPETTILNGHTMIVFRQPIFLYESAANFVLWILITASPAILRVFNFKRKPWQLHPDKYHLLTFEQFNQQKHSNNWLKWKWFNHKLKQQFWMAAFYDYQPDSFVISNIKQEYATDVKKVGSTRAYLNRSQKFYKIYNPDNYWMIRAGTQMGIYFFGWNLIRFCLETLRSDDAELFIIHNRPVDYAVLISIFIFGIILAAICQFLSARFLRSRSWTYEKEYKGDLKKW